MLQLLENKGLHLQRGAVTIEREGDEIANGGRGSQVWQTQDLQERIFGSVAMIGVTGDFSEVWQ